jgi:hypothetical protein
MKERKKNCIKNYEKIKWKTMLRFLQMFSHTIFGKSCIKSLVHNYLIRKIEKLFTKRLKENLIIY